MKLYLKETLFLEMLQCHLLNLGRRAGSLYMAEVFDLVDDSVSLRRVCEADFFFEGYGKYIRAGPSDTGAPLLTL